MQRRYKLSLWINNFIEEIITTTIIIVATPYTTATKGNHVALYIIRKDVAHGNILRRSKKSLKLNLRISLKTTFRNK